MIIDITPEQQKEIKDHWAKVRSGLYKSEEHEFDQDTPTQISVRKERINRYFESIAREQREIDKLVKVDCEK